MATEIAEAPPTVQGEDRPLALTSGQFFGMIEAGLFAPGQRVYLWGGGIFEKMAKTVPHAIATYMISEAIRSKMPAGWLIWPENPVQLDARHAPLPDIALVRGPVDIYRRENRHPSAADVGLVIEIAASSLAKDLGERAEKFSRAMIPGYWVADVIGRKVVEHRGPSVVGGVGRYEHVRALGLDETIALILDGRDVGPIAVRELLA